MSATLAVALFLLLAGGAASDSVPDSADPQAIPNYRRIAPGVAAAGQPSTDGLRQLKALGFRTVVNLRTDSEKGFEDEGAILREQGLGYVHVPVTPATFKPEDVDAVLKVLDNPAAGPVLLHCSTANRVGGVWAAVEVRRGRALEEALEIGRKAGLTGEAMTDAVRRVAGPR
jgi:uncharacterized protein (TIGR01244 family)